MQLYRGCCNFAEVSATFFCLRNEKKGTKGGKAVVFLGKKARIRRTDGNLGVEMRRRAPDYYAPSWFLCIRCYYAVIGDVATSALQRPHRISLGTTFSQLTGTCAVPSVLLRLPYWFTHLGYVYLFGTSVLLATLSTKYALYQTPFGFLFVRPRIRYCFFSPKPRDLKLASCYGVHR